MKTLLSKLTWVVFAVALLSTSVFGQGSEEEARKYLLRGMAAAEMATSEAGLANAVREFRKATDIAPKMPAAWYNLGLAQAKMGKPREAIESYRKYLALAPQAEDAGKVRDEIFKLEYKAEQTEKLNSYNGTWIDADGNPFQMTVSGSKITLRTEDYQIPITELQSGYAESKLANRPPLKRNIKLKYVFELQGERVNGMWQREKFRDYVCQVPEDGGELMGELRESDGTLVLRYTVTPYWSLMQQYLIGDDFCRNVIARDKKETEKKFKKQ